MAAREGGSLPLRRLNLSAGEGGGRTLPPLNRGNRKATEASTEASCLRLIKERVEDRKGHDQPTLLK